MNAEHLLFSEPPDRLPSSALRTSLLPDTLLLIKLEDKVIDPFFFFLYTLIRYEYLWRIFFFLLTLQRSVLLNIILHIYESYSMNFYLKGSLLFSERHYRVNSEEEERDISAKRRKKTNEGVARSRGWVIDGRQSVRSWTRRKLIRVGRKFN